MNDQTPWTIQRLLVWTADYFTRSGSDSPRLDAEILLSHSLGCKRIELYTRFDQVPATDQVAEFRGKVKRRAAGEPVAYLVQHKEFYSLPFYVDPNVLIPRPETEQLVVEVLDAARLRKDWTVPAIVDVGTGSGVIAVTLARHLPAAKIWATDSSDTALAVARRNAAQNNVESRIEFCEGDLLEPVADAKPFQIIVSNPPYIGLDEKKSLPKSVVDFEPFAALFSSGPSGTETIARLVEQAAEMLVAGGLLIYEISPLISSQIRSMMVNEIWDDCKVKKDLAGHDRIVIAVRR